MTINYQKKGGVPLQNTAISHPIYYRFSTLLLLFTLTACGGKSSDTTTNQENTETTPVETVIEQPIIQEPEVTEVIESPEVVTPVEPEPEQTENNPPQQTTKRILPLGDSITHGGDGFPSYRRVLWRLLKSANFDIDFIGSHRDFSGDIAENLQDFDLDHEGHWAWETNELEDKLPEWIKGYTPDIVLLHTGTNDVDRDQSHESTIAEISRIIDILRAKNPQVIILLAKIIPMRGEDTAEFNEFVEDFVGIKNTQQSPVVIVDQYSNYSPQNDSHDKWHPNSVGEQKMANNWFNALLPYL
ncbi:MAG: SGNH/GDSL hydrolase family protein [Cocleimonas sp.]